MDIMWQKIKEVILSHIFTKKNHIFTSHVLHDLNVCGKESITQYQSITQYRTRSNIN